jgi:Holliday junction DNA helicase RuvA
MIAFLSGKLAAKSPTWAVVETAGVGFHVFIPVSSFNALGPPGSDIRLLTHLHVREDALQLYGFATEAERRLFLLLISVSGVGPKLAQGILSGISVDEFEAAVRSQDAASLVKVPGVGRKTADRLVLELRDKIGEAQAAGPDAAAGLTPSIEEEAVMALVSLGYKRSQAQEAVRKILKTDPSTPLEEALKRALRIM